jgi:hypothetical protein
VGPADLRLERGRRALGDDPAVGDDPDAVGELVGLLEVLGGEENGRAVAVERLDLAPDRLPAHRIEAGRRLVEEQHARLVDERRGEVEPAPHPARVRTDPTVGGRDEVDAPEQRVGAALALGTRQPVERRLELDQLAPGHQRVERCLLESDADRLSHLARLGDDVVAGDPGAAAGRAKQRRQHPHGRRLAGAVRPEERVDLARCDLEVDAVDGPDPALELALQA